MTIPRELIYAERKDINEFGIQDESSLNSLVYDWLLEQTDLKPFEPNLSKRRLAVFNDAYYICTIILIHQTKEDFANYAKESCGIPSVVLPLVYLYISKIREVSYSNKRLLKDIKTGLKAEGWEDNLKSLIKCTKAFPSELLGTEFARRDFSKDLLSNISWYKVTDGYKTNIIERVVKIIAKSETDWTMMLDAIKNAALEYEWEYNKELDYFDDEGNWCHDTPKDMSPICQYCDELKSRYAEESCKDKECQIISTNESTEIGLIKRNSIKTAKKGRPEAAPFSSFIMRDTPECFMPILKEMLDGKKGRSAALIIRACIGYWILTPLQKSVCNEFPSVNTASLSPYMKELFQFPNEEIEVIRKEIQSKIDKIQKESTSKTGINNIKTE